MDKIRTAEKTGGVETTAMHFATHDEKWEKEKGDEQQQPRMLLLAPPFLISCVQECKLASV